MKLHWFPRVSVWLLAVFLMTQRLVNAAAFVSGHYSGDSDTKRMQSVLTGAAEVQLSRRGGGRGAHSI